MFIPHTQPRRLPEPTRGCRARNGSSRHRGFTLIESAITTTIIGVAVVAVLQLLATGTRTTGDCLRLTSGMHLAQDLREYTVTMSADEIDAMNGRTYSPPRDARGNTLSGMTGWSQTVSVEGADLQRLNLSVPVDSSPIRRVTVAVAYRGNPVISMRWLATE